MILQQGLKELKWNSGGSRLLGLSKRKKQEIRALSEASYEALMDLVKSKSRSKQMLKVNTQ